MVKLNRKSIEIKINTDKPELTLIHLQRAVLQYWQKQIKQIQDINEYAPIGDILLTITDGLKHSNIWKNRGVQGGNQRNNNK